MREERVRRDGKEDRQREKEQTEEEDLRLFMGVGGFW